MSRRAFAAFTVMIAALSAAPGAQLPVRLYTTDDGLPSNRINRIVQDSRGFLWFCTREGISRFDGYQFTNFGREQGLPDRDADLLETRTGEYWIATSDGVAQFNPTSSRPEFTLYRPTDPKGREITSLADDGAGGIWCGTAGGLYRLERADPDAGYTYLYGVNNRGVAIGYYGDGTTQHTATYSVESRTWTALPDIPGYPENEGYGINDDGIAVGNAFEGSTSVAWIWDAATRSYSFFAVPGATQYTTSPSGLNDKGQVAGYFADASGVYHGFLKEYGTYTTIDAPGATETFLDGLNNSGVIQGQIFNADYVAEGFTATSGGLFTIVNYPGPKMTALVGINNRGDVCGGYWEIFGANQAFIALRSQRKSFEP